MSDSNFFVSHEGKTEGPFSITEVRKRLHSNDYSFVDFLWVPENSEWQLLANFFAEEFVPPKEPPPGFEGKLEKRLKEREFKGEAFSQELGVSNEPIWFLYRDKTKYGPYRYLEIVRLLQTNSCSRDDFVWKPGFEDWTRLKACPEFEEQLLQKLINLKSFGAEKVFIQRRFPRVPYECEVIVHDESRVVFGTARSLSEGGAFVEISKPTHTKGDRIKLHFSPGAVDVAFNCIAEVTQVAKGPPSGYNVKFVYIEDDDRKKISEYAQRMAAKTAG